MPVRHCDSTTAQALLYEARRVRHKHNVGVGWRTVSAEFAVEPSGGVLAWIEQFCACADWYGTNATLETRNEDGNFVIEITLDGNSGHLNNLTPVLCDAAAAIANDIAPEDVELAQLAAQAVEQLRQQLVHHDPDRIAVFSRPGREASERLAGESSPPALMAELDLHYQRLLEDLTALADAQGPTAWRQRLDMAFRSRVDALAVINVARRLERIVADIPDRLDDAHLTGALQRFENSVGAVPDLRNIAEHIDEYSVGRGRLDTGRVLEPGEVIELETFPSDVWISARGRTVKVNEVKFSCEQLAACANATTSVRFFDLYFPDGLDFDFLVEDSDGITRVATDLTEEQRAIKQMLRDPPRRPPPDTDRGLCPRCGMAL